MNSNDDILAQLQDGVMTHLDIRKNGQEVFEKTTANENKWGVLIGTHLGVLFKQIDAKDEAGMHKTMDSLLAETIKLRKKNVEDTSRLLGEKMAESYSIGFAEGTYDSIKHITKLIQEKVGDGSLRTFDDLQTLLKIIDDVATQQYNEAFEGKPTTFFAAPSKK